MKKLFAVEITTTLVVVAEDARKAEIYAQANASELVGGPSDEKTVRVAHEITRAPLLPQYWKATYRPYGNDAGKCIFDYFKEQES